MAMFERVYYFLKKEKIKFYILQTAFSRHRYGSNFFLKNIGD